VFTGAVAVHVHPGFHPMNTPALPSAVFTGAAVFTFTQAFTP